jgi:hypothetical protein
MRQSGAITQYVSMFMFEPSQRDLRQRHQVDPERNSTRNMDRIADASCVLAHGVFSITQC